VPRVRILVAVMETSADAKMQHKTHGVSNSLTHVSMPMNRVLRPSWHVSKGLLLLARAHSSANCMRSFLCRFRLNSTVDTPSAFVRFAARFRELSGKI
jgi:hypothetical protein